MLLAGVKLFSAMFCISRVTFHTNSLMVVIEFFFYNYFWVLGVGVGVLSIKSLKASHLKNLINFTILISSAKYIHIWRINVQRWSFILSAVFSPWTACSPVCNAVSIKKIKTVTCHMGVALFFLIKSLWIHKISKLKHIRCVGVSILVLKIFACMLRTRKMFMQNLPFHNKTRQNKK